MNRIEEVDFMDRVKKILDENPRGSIKPPPKCLICNDEGRIPYFKVHNNIRYEYYCHCTCDTGKAFIYEGRYCKDKSSYRMASIEEILPTCVIEELKEENKKKRRRIHEQSKNHQKVDRLA